ncbi:MAG: CAAX amino terminal protease self- immunity [candidate division TA06 bacterium ADurb.Bin417]|uniref:CAAX amino terminal protease self-immunity n=1 Tax=candidate division TA06 bacterium ADurb.Bin417 TaxID=1852828 RepID=A0A1V5MJD3_UNCT6|nr:MAG: CAAX amino terminal protease self- immunity [candidate division TA06 bacterium ADurb.Bin417]
MKILLVTPPLVQLNTPYPATPALAGFLRSQGADVAQADLSLELALRLFTRPGLAQVAAACRSRPRPTPAVRAFLARLEDYLSTVEAAVAFLQGRDESVGWRIARRDFLPEGPRFATLAPEGCGLDADENLHDLFGALGVTDRAKLVASLYLDDLADVIREGADPEFGFSRYAERLGVSLPTFDPLLARLAAPPTLVDTLLDALAEETLLRHAPDWVGLTLPFPGTVYGAFRIAAVLRRLAPHVRIVMGGGYVNTELRELSDPRVFEYADALCFDGKLSFNHSAARAIIFSAALQLCLVGAILAGLRRRFLGTWQLGLDAWKTGYLRAGFWTYFSILPILAVIGLLQGLLQHGRLPDQEIYAVLMRIDSQGLLLLYLAVIALAAPFLEEIIFRGFLFGTLRSLFGYRRAALYSSLIFASLHQSVFAFLPIFCLALALCWLYEKSGSLWPSVVLHLLNNTVTAVFVLLLRQAIS